MLRAYQKNRLTLYLIKHLYNTEFIAADYKTPSAGQQIEADTEH